MAAGEEEEEEEEIGASSEVVFLFEEVFFNRELTEPYLVTMSVHHALDGKRRIPRHPLRTPVFADGVPRAYRMSAGAPGASDPPQRAHFSVHSIQLEHRRAKKEIDAMKNGKIMKGQENNESGI